MLKTMKVLYGVMAFIFLIDIPVSAINAYNLSVLYVLVILLDICLIGIQVISWSNINAIERTLNSGNLDDWQALESLVPKMSTYSWLTNTSMIVRCVVLLIISVITHRFADVIINILLIIWLLYLNNKNHKDHQKQLSKLIGAKSQALLDKLKLPETQPGFSPA